MLSRPFVFELHRRMFGDVWRWAGTQRRRETNIGADPAHIVERVQQVLDDAAYWHHHEVYATDERAARLHHRLVWVHPFPNGNGRCTRLLADLYLVAVGRPRFTWGAATGARVGDETRRRYLAALRAADRDDIAELVTFARS